MKTYIRRSENRAEKGEYKETLTTPTLTLSGLWSARNASVTPRMGSFAAGSTLLHHDDMDRFPGEKAAPPRRPTTPLNSAPLTAIAFAFAFYLPAAVAKQQRSLQSRPPENEAERIEKNPGKAVL